MSGLAIIFGFFSATAALLAQVFLSMFVTTTPIGSPSLLILIGAATLEEGAKLVFLLQLGKRSPDTLSWLHASLFGLGFVSAEIALVMLSSSAPSEPTSLGAMAGIHLLGTLIIYSGLRLQESYSLSPLVCLIGAILVHVLYNSSL